MLGYLIHVYRFLLLCKANLLTSLYRLTDQELFIELQYNRNENLIAAAALLVLIKFSFPLHLEVL